jgi:hypothetical protein
MSVAIERHAPRDKVNHRFHCFLKRPILMKITRVKAHPMSMKLDKIYWTSRAAWGTYNTIVVEVETRREHHRHPHHQQDAVVAAQPHGYCVESFPSVPRDPFWHQVLTQKPKLEAGKLTLGYEPGFGIEIDRKMVERWKI